MGATKLLTAAGGGIILDAASTATDKTITIPAVTGTMTLQETKITSGTAVASTSGTSIDFTSIPSWVKRITVMFNGLSTNGTSPIQIQVGSGSVTTSGYLSQSWTSAGAGVVTTGFAVTGTNTASYIWSGSTTLTLIGSNTWICQGLVAYVVGTSSGQQFAGNSPALSGALDRIRITTVNGTDTFDAGSINILYE
jgi:hypothetical protein